jgi:hypothetical protein
MLSPVCLQSPLAPPLLSTEALSELHDLLASLPIPFGCDRACLNSSPKEGIDEANDKAAPPTNESSTLQRAGNSNPRRAAGRTDQRPDGTANPGSGSQKRAARKRRRG